MFFRKEAPSTATVGQPMPDASFQQLLQQMEALASGQLAEPLVLPPENVLQPFAAALEKVRAYYASLNMNFSLEMTQLVALAAEQGRQLNNIVEMVEQQMQAIGKINEAVGQLTHSVMAVADSATDTAQQTTQGSQAADGVRSKVAEAAAETRQAQTYLTSLKGSTDELQESAARIGNLVGVVRHVAEQTNLLSLNAAIEAARAGELGRGFGVVADEVRNLADQSRQSVGEITDQVHAIQNHIEEIGHGVKQMNQSFAGNVEAVQESAGKVEALAAAFEHINNAMTRLAPVTQEQSASFQEMSATIEHVTGTFADINENIHTCNHDLFAIIGRADGLRGKINSLALPFAAADVLELAKADHLLWKARVDYMLKGVVTLQADTVRDHHVCRLGKWYFGAGQALFGTVPAYRQLDDLHARFHQGCAQAIELYQRGQVAAAREKARELDELSRGVLALLDALKQQAAQS